MKELLSVAIAALLAILTNKITHLDEQVSELKVAVARLEERVVVIVKRSK